MKSKDLDNLIKQIAGSFSTIAEALTIPSKTPDVTRIRRVGGDILTTLNVIREQEANEVISGNGPVALMNRNIPNRPTGVTLIVTLEEDVDKLKEELYLTLCEFISTKTTGFPRGGDFIPSKDILLGSSNKDFGFMLPDGAENYTLFGTNITPDGTHKLYVALDPSIEGLQFKIDTFSTLEQVTVTHRNLCVFKANSLRKIITNALLTVPGYTFKHSISNKQFCNNVSVYEELFNSGDLELIQHFVNLTIDDITLHLADDTPWFITNEEALLTHYISPGKLYWDDLSPTKQHQFISLLNSHIVGLTGKGVIDVCSDKG